MILLIHMQNKSDIKESAAFQNNPDYELLQNWRRYDRAFQPKLIFLRQRYLLKDPVKDLNGNLGTIL